MRTYVIFSEEELEELALGNSIDDDANNITYISKKGYDDMLERRQNERD